MVFGGRAGGRAATHDRRVAAVAARGLPWLFPQLEGVRFTHAWGGPIDMTASFLPFYKTLEPGTIHAGLGFSGHGLSQTMVGGRILASLVLGLDDEWTSLPVVGPEISKTPPEPFRYAATMAAERTLEWGDRRQDAGRRRGVMPSLIGDAPGRYRELLAARGSRRGELTDRSVPVVPGAGSCVGSASFGWKRVEPLVDLLVDLALELPSLALEWPSTPSAPSTVMVSEQR